VSAITLELRLPEHFLSTQDQREGFVLLAAFLVSFLFIRTSARLMRSPKVPWWPGSVKTGSGLHLHHLVWGILLLLICGFLGFATSPASPWGEILAALFGVGAGLTLDEFALWVHLEDVYWTEEGRSSIDAVVVATVIGGLIVSGVAPFELTHNAASVESLVAIVILDILLATLAILKGKRLLGLVGIFIPLASLTGAIRLAKPSSPWARRRYGADSDKQVRAEARWARVAARRRRLSDALAGAPDAPSASG
jgi:hypothetical protein